MTDFTFVQSLITPAGQLPVESVEMLLDREATTIESLMLDLLPLAVQRARAPISNFAVGAVALGDMRGDGAGALYLGANCEFLQTALGSSVHAEQSAVNNAWLNGETKLQALAVSQVPCGHCRQFLSEVAGAGTLAILVPADHSDVNRSCTKHSLEELFPFQFSGEVLGGGSRLMQRSQRRVGVTSQDPLVLLAVDAAQESYAPYTGNLSGVALRMADDSTLTGRIAENAAFNPTLSPMASALAWLSLQAGDTLPQVVDAVLVEVPTATSQQRQCEELLWCATGGDVALRYIVGKTG